MEFGFTVKQIIEEGRVTQEDVDLTRRWLSTQNLPKLTNEQIVIFLLSCNNEQEATRATIQVHYFLKKNAPEIIDDRKLTRGDLQQQLKTTEFCVFPEKTDDGCAVIFARLLDTYYRSFEFGPALKLLNMMLDSVVYDYPPTGLIILFDMTGVGLMHLTRVRLGLVNLLFRYLQEGFPVKLKEIHIINTVYFIDKVLTIVKPFISKKVLDLVRFHPKNMDMEAFYDQCIPKHCLPKDYGGDLPPVSVLHERNVQNLAHLGPLFEAEELQRHSANY